METRLTCSYFNCQNNYLFCNNGVNIRGSGSPVVLSCTPVAVQLAELAARSPSAALSSPSRSVTLTYRWLCHAHVRAVNVRVLSVSSYSFSHNERIFQLVGLRCYRLRPGPHALSLPFEGDLEGECACLCGCVCVAAAILLTQNDTVTLAVSSTAHLDVRKIRTAVKLAATEAFVCSANEVVRDRLLPLQPPVSATHRLDVHKSHVPASSGDVSRAAEELHRLRAFMGSVPTYM